jgi:hypothetical protein
MRNLLPAAFFKLGYALPWERSNHIFAKVLGTGFPQALAGRVISKPAGGNDPKQSFSSCMGMEIYER